MGHKLQSKAFFFFNHTSQLGLNLLLSLGFYMHIESYPLGPFLSIDPFCICIACGKHDDTLYPATQKDLGPVGLNWTTNLVNSCAFIATIIFDTSMWLESGNNIEEAETYAVQLDQCRQRWLERLTRKSYDQLNDPVGNIFVQMFQFE